MNPSRSETRLRKREAAALFAEKIRPGHAHAFELDLAVPFRRRVIDHRDIADHLDARCVARNKNHALLTMTRRVRIRFPHHNEELAVRVRGVRDKPLPAVDNVVVTVATNRRRDIGRVRGGYRRLRHRKRGADLAVKKRFEPLLALRGRGKHMEQFHIPRVRCIAVEYLGRPRHPPHDFSERRILEIGQAGTGFIIAQMWQEQVPEPLLTRALLQILHKGNRILTRTHFVVPLPDTRNDMSVHEGAHLSAQRVDFRAVGKVHFYSSRIVIDLADALTITMRRPLD